MSRTYTSASDRDLRRAAGDSPRLQTAHVLLVLTSAIAMLALGLAFKGRMATLDSTPAVNLNTVASASDLEPLLDRLDMNAGDRRMAARSVFEFVLGERKAGGSLPNVGTLARAKTRNKAGGDSTPVLTSGELSQLKPSMSVRTAAEFKNQVLFWGALYLASFWLVVLAWRIRGINGDVTLLAAAHLLTAIGFAALLSRPDPLRDTMLFVRYAQAVLLGVSAFALLSAIDFRKAVFLRLSYVPFAAALLLSAVLIVFGSGPGSSNAKVNLGPVQPVELIRLLLALFLAGYFARRWELLRQVPRLGYALPVFAGVAASLGFFFLQKDLGPALFICCVFLAVYAVARNRAALAIAGFACLVFGFYAGYMLNISTTLAARVQMWLSPWDNSVRGGDQIAQSAWSLSAGGVTGTGLGLGDTRYLPAGHTDLILPAIGEELGLVGLVLLAAVFAVIAARGFRTAKRAANDYGFFLATTVTLFLIVPVFIMAAGNLGIIPLTGVVTPFLSYGGSAMLVNFAGLGILSAIRRDGRSAEPVARPAAAHQPFANSMRYLTAGLSLAGVALIAVLARIQYFSADEFVVKPHLSLQADGGRRYQYNQRVLDIARMIPRGTIYDRSGLALATSRAEVAAKAREEYKAAGLSVDASCSGSFERCYPLGGATYHLLGDARTRTNWSASNTSYIERDEENRLRGFDDHATLVEAKDASGKSNRTIRRDYRALVPLLRHRHDQSDPSWRTFLSKPRDLTLTIDSRLQARVSAILAKHAAKSATGRAAAVVIDPDTGDLLAAASYPYPAYSKRSRPEAASDDALLDRARFGLYPPGSTFKLVTAAAALNRNSQSSQSTFMCASLPDGRIGARIPGFGRVRDDVLDKHAHGSISMHDGLVRSCNAYFAQLAVSIGPQALMETASRFGISAAPANSVERLRKTLAQAGYGQGYVVTSPLRMARVAGAIAGDGIYRDLQTTSGAVEEDAGLPVLSPESAGLLGRYMRDVVLTGTGRSLSAHPARIAGKTGTAEVVGAPSHAWFVGFAPFGSHTKEIAFAVVIENAGYGGLAAAPAAGEIVSAATSLGLID